MDDLGIPVHRITCAVRQQMSSKTTELLRDMGIPYVLAEDGRNVRRRRGGRRFGFLRRGDRVDDTPIEIFHLKAEPTASETVIGRLVDGLEMTLPGRGTVYAQEIKDLVPLPGATTPSPDHRGNNPPRLLKDLALITAIMSMTGSGEELAKLALKLGTGIPLVTLGTGTGLRDQLGILRITVPPAKELVHLLVPALDAEGLMRMLIDEGRLNRPGKGFVYCRPVVRGLLDTSLQTGPQEHSASMEQIIAAIDELKDSTAWRRRFPELDADATIRMEHHGDEITVICLEKQSGHYVKAAMRAGAGGATTARLRRLRVGETPGGPRERCTIIVHRSITEQVLDALREAQGNADGQLECLEVQPLLSSFSHRPRASR